MTDVGKRITIACGNNNAYSPAGDCPAYKEKTILNTEMTMKYIAFDTTTSGGSMAHGVCHGKRNRPAFRQQAIHRQDNSAGSMHQLEHGFNHFLVVVQLDLFVLVFAAALVFRQAFFHAAAAAGITFLVSQVPANKLAHAIMQVQGGPGRDAHVQNG